MVEVAVAVVVREVVAVSVAAVVVATVAVAMVAVVAGKGSSQAVSNKYS
jgi:hypothetical protein